jgi:hypothetical protein
VQGPGPPGWELDVRVKTLLCKQVIVAKTKDVKLDGVNLLRKAMVRRGLFCQMMMMMMMMMMSRRRSGERMY